MSIFGTTFKYPYTHGFFCGDGTYANVNENSHKCIYKSVENERYCLRHRYWSNVNDQPSDICQAIVGEGTPLIALYGEKQKVLKYIDVRSFPTTDSQGRLICTLNQDLEKKFTVPLDCDLNTKLRWLEGYCDADGTLASGSIQIGSVEIDFLDNVRLMLNTLGIDPKINLGCKAGLRPLPDGHGGMK